MDNGGERRKEVERTRGRGEEMGERGGEGGKREEGKGKEERREGREREEGNEGRVESEVEGEEEKLFISDTILFQRCVELLNTLPELSHKAEMICSKATLVLADTTCIHGIDHTASCGQAEQMAEVFDGLIKTMKMQVMSNLKPHLRQPFQY
jgi:hypothetical protein